MRKILLKLEIWREIFQLFDLKTVNFILTNNF